MHKYLVGAALACISLLPHQVFAQNSAMDLTMFYPPKDAPLTDQRIYKLSFKCEPLAPLRNSQAANLLLRQNQTSSHFMVISDKVAAPDAQGNVPVPNDGVAFLPVFAVTKGVVKIDNRSSCPNPQYITGGKDLYMLGYANYSTQNEPGILVSLGYAIAGLIPPLWAMFNGKLDGPSKEQLTAYSQTEDPLKKVLSTLNKEENYPVSKPLSPGQYRISTAFSKVTINVTFVPSIIRDGGPTAMRFFRKQIDTALQTLTATDPAQCAKLATALLDLGFSKQDDIPYALAYKGIRSGLTASQASACLGSDYALAAASIKGGLWEYAGKTEQVLTVEQATADYPPPDPSLTYQIAFNEALMKTFTDNLSRLTRTDTTAPGDQATFAKALKEPVTLADKSVVKVFGGESKEYSGSELAKYFVSNGYRRFGCSQSTSLGEKLDGGRTLLFAFKADKDDTTLTIDNVIIIKPIFTEKRTVKSLIAYDDFDWIDSSMTTRDWKCGRIAIKKPTPETPAVAPAAKVATQNLDLGTGQIVEAASRH